MKKTNKAAIAFPLVLATAAIGESRIYGTIDPVLRHTTVRGGTTKSSIGNGGERGQRFGIEGDETIGSGDACTKIVYRIESGVTVDGSAAPLGGREIFLSAECKYATFKIGLTRTAASRAIEENDVFSLSGDGAANTILGTALGSQAPLLRTPQSLTVILPSRYKFYGEVQASSGDVPTYGGRIGYKDGSFSSSVGYIHAKVPNDEYQQSNVGAAYKVRNVTLKGVYIHDTLRSQHRDAFVVGAQIDLSKAWDAKVAYAHSDRHGRGEAEQGTIQLRYKPSDRTALYGGVSDITNRDGGNLALPGAVGPIPNNSRTGDIYFGMRHNF